MSDHDWGCYHGKKRKKKDDHWGSWGDDDCKTDSKDCWGSDDHCDDGWGKWGDCH
ncbi:hypothetical protein [Pseudonocardia pini]|uniref:hypothetical protein n=1 Tax=Pseudonocardia pini TaxID=2758030 RepID=UPI0015F1250E|nr:hypothetical protein [Pseudonocardia pini]